MSEMTLRIYEMTPERPQHIHLTTLPNQDNAPQRTPFMLTSPITMFTLPAHAHDRSRMSIWNEIRDLHA